MRRMQCQTPAKVALRAFDRLCRTDLTARAGPNEFGNARALPTNGSSFQSGLLLTRRRGFLAVYGAGLCGLRTGCVHDLQVDTTGRIKCEF